MDYNYKVIVSVIVITLIIMFLVYKYYKKEPEQKRKIVSVYRSDTYFGLGDYIRGVIYLLQKEDPGTIFVDYRDNPISKYLYTNADNEYEVPYSTQLVKSNEKTYKKIREEEKGNLFLEHNGMPKMPVKKHILEKVRNTFLPNKILKKSIDTTLDQLSLTTKEFIVVHIRMKDKNMELKNVMLPDLLINVLEDLKHSNQKVLVLSNSVAVKNAIAKGYKFLTTNFVPSHTGQVKGTNTNADDLLGTLTEFFMISHASFIYQYNEEPGFQSGFSQRIAELFEIPIRQI